MQTSLARRQRHRRALGRRRRGRADRPSDGRHRHPLVLVRRPSLAARRRRRRSFAVAAYSYYAQGLPDPKAAARPTSTSTQQTIVYDRTGKIELARLGELKREVVDVRRDPRRDARRDDRDRGQGLLGQPGFDPIGIVAAGIDTRPGRPRGASTITQQLVRARLLPPSAFEGSALRAQDPRDHPVDPPDPGVPRRGRQGGDHHGLPEPELLRQPELRREGRRQELLRQDRSRS